MKKLILLMISTACSGWLFAQVDIDRIPLGSGIPGNNGVENATRWDMDIYHAPQYMPGYPTAATLFPRAINVLCVKHENGLRCKGYNWLPEMGRAEYLMIRPILVEQLPVQQ
ncbi:MAG: hypothetical protein JWP96_549 [Polaromonas sp.]|jgi:hypothetical protein|nr:hypothetical protein [Polaromonas sp.]